VTCRLSAVVIVHNEADRIGACLDALSFVDELVVIDAESSDGTMAVATDRGARVISSPWLGFSEQRNLGLEACLGDWVLFIDADEIVTEAGAAELMTFLAQPLIKAVGASFPRTNHFLGKPLRAWRSGDRQLRLVRKECGCWTGSVHEKLDIRGDAHRFRTPILHYSHRTIDDQIRKLDWYADLWAEEQKKQGRTARTHHSILRPPLHFAKSVFWRGGLWDGWPGVANAALEAWYVREKWRRLRKLGRR
jgi:glycosyltransferase involved in cell wall biosynthesis